MKEVHRFSRDAGGRPHSPGKKLAILSTGLGFGGAEMQLSLLSRRLQDRGWEVRVISMVTPEPAFVQKLHEQGLDVASLDMRRGVPDPRGLLRLRALLRSWRPDVLHSYMIHANVLGRIARLVAPVPVVVSTAQNVSTGGRLLKALYRATDRLSDYTTNVSQAAVDRFLEAGMAPAGAIHLIPNAVDTEHFRGDPEARRHLRQALRIEGNFAWIAVGRFEPQKDHAALVRAFQQVSRQAPRAVLLLVGEGGLKAQVHALVESLGLDEQVRFLNFRRDIVQLMNAADAYVMSSRWEGMAMVLLEASAVGLPCVATTVGGNGEVIRSGETGFVVAPGDTSALAQAMLDVMAIPAAERQRMGARGRAHVQANYDLAAAVEEWESVYFRLLSERGES